ncbi:MAG TPA: DNA (cytosine-5-)-methyltransferase [Allosphingosinicella sp.]|jgi:DNA (cytosine-5)-methyltransferase 1
MLSFSALRTSAGLTQIQVSDEFAASAEIVTLWETGRAPPPANVVQSLKLLAQVKGGPEPARPGIRFVDLFAGIGGLRKAFEPFGKCVFTSEWDRFAQETYRENYLQPNEEIHGDIRLIPEEAIPKHDVLLAGFPCQPFSLAGVSKKNALNRPHGFACETQGTLFFEIKRILAAHRPKAFLLENVKNLVNHDQGRTFRVIKHVLEEELRYKVKPILLNARAWVPQHRERIFIAGFADENSDFSFEDFQEPSLKNGPTLRDILHPEDGSEKVERKYTGGPNAAVLPKYTLSDHLWRYLQEYADKHRDQGNGFGFGLVGPADVSRTLSARYYKDGSEILIRQDGKAPRRLTPRECARLMGFDQPGKSEFRIPVSDTQAYKQFGNAVVVPVAKAVARHMMKWVEPVAFETQEHVMETTAG